jgi:hypothetical protein
MAARSTTWRRGRVSRLCVFAALVSSAGSCSACAEREGPESSAGDRGPTAVSSMPPVWFHARATVDRPDDHIGYQIHVVYAVPSDGFDEQLDIDGTLALSVAAWNEWLAVQTGGSRLRLDTHFGVLDVTFARLDSTAAEIAAEGLWAPFQIEADLGFRLEESFKIYAVYYGARGDACGQGGLDLRSSIVYMHGRDGACGGTFASSVDQFGPLEVTMLHELMHTLGAAPSCAPHRTALGHVSDDPADIMYEGDEFSPPIHLDVGHDDYWAHANTGCPDAARSVFLDPLPPGARPPPGWGY